MNKIILYSFFLIVMMSACKKEADPLGFVAEARINFFNAAHYPTPYIAMNVFDTARFKDPSVLDFFGRETYPYAPPVGNELKFGAIAYLAVPAGPQHFYFADSAKELRLERSFQFQADHYTNLYLTDSLLHYDVLEVPADPLAQYPGKVRIRIINLVPDAVLNLKITDEEGNQHIDDMPQGIRYRSFNNIIEPDTAKALNGSFYFRLYHQDETGEKLIAIVPPVKATTGKEYTIVVKGYRNDYIVDAVHFKKGVTAVLRVGN